MTTTTTNRLDLIAQRSRQARIRDFAFAALIAVFMVLQVTSLRAAAQTANRSPAKAAPALIDGTAVGAVAACNVTPSC